MPEIVELSTDRTCILVVSSGEPSLTELETTLRQIVLLRNEHSINRVLVDSRLRSEHISVRDLYAGGKMVAERLGDDVRLAIVVNRTTEELKLFESIVVVYGGMAAFFHDMDHANEWLENVSPTNPRSPTLRPAPR